ncbi:MAG: CocE/NonD family hydrolase [Myxococcota bacterium]
MRRSLTLLWTLGCLAMAPTVMAQTTVNFFMSDGVELATDIYSTTFEPQPVLMIRTPDGRGDLEEFAWSLVNRYDVKVVVQDIRGHGDSGGEEALFSTAAADGLATLGWMDTLGWSNGIVGGYGKGINGYEQLLIAGAGDPSFKCLYLQNTSANLPHAGIYEGGLRRSEFDIWAKGQGAAWAPDEWSLHPNAADPYWELLQFSEADAALINVPGLHVTGWYDVNQRGAIEGFRRLQDHGGPGAAGRQRLVIGPWSYKGGTGDLEFPDAIDSETVLEWEKAWATDCLHGETGTLDELPEVLLYIMGSDEPEAPGNVWETFEAWPPPSIPVPLYLRNKERLTTSPPGSGELGQLFEHEPLSPVGTAGGRNLRIGQGPKDQSDIEGRDDVAVYTSEPLKDPVTVIGNVSASLWILSDWDITDVVVRLTDVYPDGRSMLIASGVRRVGKQLSEQLVEVDLWATGAVFNTGHQIRISISGAMHGAYTFAEERFTALVSNNLAFPSSVTLPVLSGLSPEPIGAELGDGGDMAEVPLDAIEDLDVEPALDSIGPVEDVIITEVIDSDTDDGLPPWAIPEPPTPADEGEGEDEGGCQSSRPVHSGALAFLVIGLWISLRRRTVA